MRTLVVLAGGFGTRLRSLVSDVPKPLADVLGRPFISHLINHWIAQGVKDFVFLLHYESDQISRFLLQISDDPDFINIKFKVVIEEIPLGTGGSILNAIHELDIQDSFLVANADTWLGSGIDVLSAAAPCALAAVKVPNSQRYGALRFDGARVDQFQEKSESVGEGYVSSGLYHLSPVIFEQFEFGSNFSLEEDVFPKLVEDKTLGFIKLNTSFIDIGIPEDYLRFCRWVQLGFKNDI